jgi:hypothetical protein
MDHCQRGAADSCRERDEQGDEARESSCITGDIAAKISGRNLNAEQCIHRGK